jgi:hypothetical protein
LRFRLEVRLVGVEIDAIERHVAGTRDIFRHRRRVDDDHARFDWHGIDYVEQNHGVILRFLVVRGPVGGDIYGYVDVAFGPRAFRRQVSLVDR